MNFNIILGDSIYIYLLKIKQIKQKGSCKDKNKFLFSFHPSLFDMKKIYYFNTILTGSFIHKFFKIYIILNTT